MKFKKSLFISLFFILGTIDMYGQVPGNLSFQAVIRNASNQLVISSPVGLKVSLLQGGANGTSVYSETHNVTTNSNGLVTLEIGGGTPITGDFKTVDWSRGNYFIKIEADPTGGTNYSIVTSSQILSVPYALYAKKSADVDSLVEKVRKLDSLFTNTLQFGKTNIIITGDIDELGVKNKLAKEYGTNTESITVQNCTILKNLDLSIVTRWVNFKIERNYELVNINLSNLPSIEAGVIIGECPKLKTILFSKLQKIIISNPVEEFRIQSTSLDELNIPELTILEGFLNIYDNSHLKKVNLTKLIGSYSKIQYSNFRIGSSVIGINSCDSLKNIHLDSLKQCYDITVSNCGQIDSLSLKNLMVFEQLQLSNNRNLSYINLDSIQKIGKIEGFIDLSFNNLSSQYINYFLSKAVTVSPQVSLNNPVKNFILYNQRTPAPPTGQGLIDRNTLISRGHSVITD